MIKKGDTVTHRNGQEGTAMRPEKDGNVTVKVKGTTQEWSVYDLAAPTSKTSSKDADAGTADK